MKSIRKVRQKQHPKNSELFDQNEESRGEWLLRKGGETDSKQRRFANLRNDIERSLDR